MTLPPLRVALAQIHCPWADPHLVFADVTAPPRDARSNP